MDNKSEFELIDLERQSGNVLQLSAENAVVISCGASSLTLHSNGEIVISGRSITTLSDVFTIDSNITDIR